MLPVLLALECALCYGGSDYTSGLAVGQANPLKVAVNCPSGAIRRVGKIRSGPGA
jgi:hypothetical protein